MEDPVRFDVWGRARPEARNEVANFLRETTSWNSELKLARWVREVMRAQTAVKLASSLSWHRALEMRDTDAPFHEMEIFQTGYGPTDAGRLQSCSIHELTFAGCLGCPVCNARHEP